MLKIFSTQLQGSFKKILDDEMSIEEAARLLAQGAAGDGRIFIHGFGEMEGIVAEALLGVEPFPHASPLFVNGKQESVSNVDRVLLFSRYANDPEAVALAQHLQEKGIPVAAVSTIQSDEGLHTVCDIHIDLKLVKGLIPDEQGNRVGFPSLMVALFAYYGIKFTLEEILHELEEEL
ncbi:DUF2529 domain-containing protein [Peribacillus tepidiphilus]|jgi:uncharacterized phosphosugar-binding protein|uniref:DUF2529 domain-containing protein n=1 Tax=Peribacillus tepidiphilus TaxID=2652445 RepID=UPI0035B56125